MAKIAPHSIDSMTMPAQTMAPAEVELVAGARLQGTVWERVDTAHLAYGGLLRIGAVLGRVGVSANALTLGSLLLACAAFAAAAQGAFGWAAALVVLSGVLDVLDGAVARATGSASPFGALLDSTVDRLSDALPLMGVAVFVGTRGPAGALVLLTVLAVFSVSYVRARAEGLGVRLPPLFMRRAERFVLLTAALLAGTVDVTLPFGLSPLVVGVATMGVLSTVGVIVALWSARRAFSATGADPGLQEFPPARRRP